MKLDVPVFDAAGLPSSVVSSDTDVLFPFSELSALTRILRL
jgi:hypothetical protein